MLLGAAQHFAKQRDFDGTVYLIFQPAEEHPGGAKIMIEEGLFERFPCDAIFAAHNMPGVPAGQLVFIEGPAMASSDDVTITLTGVGGHGAMPHRAQDPIVAAAAIVMTLQTIVSRQLNISKEPAVLSIGKFIGGNRNNIIPDTASIFGTCRTLSTSSLERLVQGIERIAGRPQGSFGSR